MKRFRVLALGTIALSTSTAAYCYQKLNNEKATVSCEKFELYNGTHTLPKTKSNSWDKNWDLRHPEYISEHLDDANKDKSVNPTATRHVLLVRHGQYCHYEGGDHLRKLTDLGQQQARETGERLKSLDITFDRLVISTMTRATETGQIIAEFLPDVQQEPTSLLHEGRPCRPESARSRFNSIGWKQGVFVDNPRIESAFRKYIHRADATQKEDSYDVLVCHANVIRYFVVRAMQFPPEFWLKMSLAHCGITWISIPPSGEAYVTKYGESGHLPPNLVTFRNVDPPAATTVTPPPATK